MSRPHYSETFVFISYARADQVVADALQRDLGRERYSTWRDRTILPGEDFHDKIVRALDASTAVIVIWSDAAIKSEWVRDEAHRAHKQNKLICTHVPGFDLTKLPLGMGQLHSVDITQRASIRLVINKLGVMPSTSDDIFEDDPKPLSEFIPDLARIRSRLPPDDHRLPDINSLIEIIAKPQETGLETILAGLAVTMIEHELGDLPQEDVEAIQSLSGELHYLMNRRQKP